MVKTGIRCTIWPLWRPGVSLTLADAQVLTIGLLFRYCIRIPESWDPVRGCCPIVLFHGLGIGLMQYKLLIYNLLRNFSDRPVLIPIQPNISQDIFHSKFLKPMNKHEMTAHLSGLLKELGWVSSNDRSLSPLNTPSQGIVILSHSK